MNEHCDLQRRLKRSRLDGVASALSLGRQGSRERRFNEACASLNQERPPMLVANDEPEAVERSAWSRIQLFWMTWSRCWSLVFAEIRCHH